MSTSGEHATVLPFPLSYHAAIREVEGDGLPRWCVRRLPAVGSAAVTIVAIGGDGYPLLIASVALAFADYVEAMAQQLVDEASGEPPLRRPLLAVPLGLDRHPDI